MIALRTAEECERRLYAKSAFKKWQETILNYVVKIQITTLKTIKI
jgi:hypothetical protein